MTSPVFLVERGQLVAGDRIMLDGTEGRHAATVRRIGVGERVDVTDGEGTLAECRVAAAKKSGLQLEVLARRTEAVPQPRLVVVQALPKGDRGELAVETMTEVGVDAVVPWAASRCVTQWRPDRAAKALAKWRNAAREAAKQSRRAWVPEVTEPVSTRGVAELLAAAALPVVLDSAAQRPLTSATVPSGGDMVVVVGPEGGISPDELDIFGRAGGMVYRLGPTVLRTSTAGVAAATVLFARSTRWR
jgi:16S rRNA (uracil1498-N3)-methyltransferase